MRSPIFSGAIIALLLVPALSMAWTGPTAAPPNGNVSAPINAGSIGQTKAGDLGILGKVGVGTYTPGTQLDVVGGYIRVQNTWGSNDYIAINGNQVWNTAGGNALYLQWSNPGGSVTVGGQAGATNNLSVQGAITARDSVTSPQYCIGGSCISSWNSGSIGGSGTTGYIPRFTAGTTLGNSSISSDGTSATANGNFTATGQLNGAQVCINGTCKSSWPATGFTTLGAVFLMTDGNYSVNPNYYTPGYLCPNGSLQVGIGLDYNGAMTGVYCRYIN